jgi:hypothetical protein
MALKLVINISKKVPGPQDFSSIQASCSLEGECSIGQDPTAETARLFAQAESAVDAQLKLTAAPTTPIAPPSSTPIPTSNHGPTTSVPTPNSTRGYQRTGRKVALATPSQLGLIDRLLRETNTNVNAVLNHYQVGSLDQIACKDVSALIDELKARQSGAART